MNALSDELRVELSGLCENRAAVYGLLSRLYCREADEILLCDLRNTSFPAKTGNDKVDAGYRKLATYLSGNPENALTELAVDYVNVFFGNGNLTYSAAYPFESVYTSEKRLMMQEARDEVLEAYRNAHMEIDRSWKDPADHVALELLYMQKQSERARDALDNEEFEEALEIFARQRDFFVNHLAAWTPMMTTDMKRIAKTEFYQGLAYLTEGFLQTDRGFLASVISQ
ncbi:MAG: molecular chaperone TorD family protein [Coriobacteriales bacterium]|jgi:TorA maturation chaperone TorD|nr:molecular chaperone TorD family protein [Coriobacteriales bacterium]